MTQTADQLASEFALHVIGQNEAIMTRGDARIGNKHAKQYLRCFDLLYSLGAPGLDKLSELFHHEDPGVRSMAATFLLRYKTDEALTVLRELSNGTGLVAFGSQEAIKRWEEGSWDLEPRKQI